LFYKNQPIALFVRFHLLYYLREVEDLNSPLSVNSTIGLKLCQVPFGIDNIVVVAKIQE